MTQRVVVDTDVLIDVFRQVEVTTAILQAIANRSLLCISAVTQMELLVGCRDARELQNLDRFLEPFEVVNLSEETSRRAIQLLRQYRLSHGLLIPDALIAATVLVTGYDLLTKNQSDYRFIENINLLPFSV